MKIAETILEMLQGPCRGNQRYFIVETQLVRLVNSYMQRRDEDLGAFLVGDKTRDQTKITMFQIIHALMEGQGQANKQDLDEFDRVFEIVFKSINMPVFRGIVNEPGNGEFAADVRMSGVLLLETLVDHRPELRDEVYNGITPLSEEVRSVIDEKACAVEVIWDHEGRDGFEKAGSLQRYFFPLPEVYRKHMSDMTKQRLIDSVDRSSQEMKLINFVKLTNDTYEELKHLKYLGEIRVPLINRCVGDVDDVGDVLSRCSNWQARVQYLKTPNP